MATGSSGVPGQYGALGNLVGGGIDLSATDECTIANTIDALNTVHSSEFQTTARPRPIVIPVDYVHAAGTVLFDDGHNLVGAADANSGFSASLSGDFVGTAVAPLNPLLGELTNNGGATETMALLTGSLALGTGDAGLAVDAHGKRLQFDQRGLPRVVGKSMDIGAYEQQGSSPF